ncbi:Hypothetical predicted protein, partial [Mytilus galloprovincialis]
MSTTASKKEEISTREKSTSSIKEKTNNISTNISDPKFVKRSSTKELHFSVTTTLSIAVSVILA